MQMEIHPVTGSARFRRTCGGNGRMRFWSSGQQISDFLVRKLLREADPLLGQVVPLGSFRVTNFELTHPYALADDPCVSEGDERTVELLADVGVESNHLLEITSEQLFGSELFDRHLGRECCDRWRNLARTRDAARRKALEPLLFQDRAGDAPASVLLEEGAGQQILADAFEKTLNSLRILCECA